MDERESKPIAELANRLYERYINSNQYTEKWGVAWDRIINGALATAAEKARLEERERCASICDGFIRLDETEGMIRKDTKIVRSEIARAIRADGDKIWYCKEDDCEGH